MYLVRDKGSSGVTYMTMTINWSQSVTMSVLKTTGKCLALNEKEGISRGDRMHP